MTDHVWAFKIDHVFSEKNRISYFQSIDSQLTHGVSDFDGPLGTALGNQYQKPRIFRVNHDYTFSPTVLLHTTYGYSRTVQIWFVPGAERIRLQGRFPRPDRRFRRDAGDPVRRCRRATPPGACSRAR